MEQLPIESPVPADIAEQPAPQIVELPAPVLERVGGGIAAFTI
jgi:hypothetical protein